MTDDLAGKLMLAFGFSAWATVLFHRLRTLRYRRQIRELRELQELRRLGLVPARARASSRRH